MLKLFRRGYSPERAVRRGAALLDRTTPDWFDLVDPTKLDVANPRYCVVGQLSGPHGGYNGKLVQLGVSPWPWAEEVSPVHFGFDIGREASLDAYDKLHELWCDEIHRRRIDRVGARPEYVAGES